MGTEVALQSGANRLVDDDGEVVGVTAGGIIDILGYHFKVFPRLVPASHVFPASRY